MEDDSLQLNEFSIEINYKVNYMKQMTRSLSPEKQFMSSNYKVRILICDQFGSLNNDLYFDPDNYIATKEKLLNIEYFLQRNEYFQMKSDIDVVSNIKKKLEMDIFGYQVSCFRRSYKISEYLDMNMKRSEIFHKKKLLRKFQFASTDKIIVKASFSQTFTAIISYSMKLYFYEIQKGIHKGPFNLISPHLESAYSLFKISNNGLFIYYDHYLMKSFEIIKYLECIYVQFRDDSAQVLLCDSEFKAQLYDLLYLETIYVIYIPMSNYANFTYFEFKYNSLVQDSISKSQRIIFYIKMKPDQIKNS